MNKKNMIYLAVGVAVGVMMADRLRRLPGVSALPTV